MKLEYTFPRIQDGTVIVGELEEETGWLPEGSWVPPSEEELRAMRVYGRLGLTHMQQAGIPVLEKYVAPEVVAPFVVSPQSSGSEVTRLDI